MGNAVLHPRQVAEKSQTVPEVQLATLPKKTAVSLATAAANVPVLVTELRRWSRFAKRAETGRAEARTLDGFDPRGLFRHLRLNY